MTAEEENPRASRLVGEVRLGDGGVHGGVGRDQTPSSPESEPFLGVRPPGPVHSPLDGGAKYTPLRRQSSTDGDMDERQSLLVGDLEEDLLAKDPHVQSATILVNKSGIRSKSDHALGRPPHAHEHYELHDMSAHAQRMRTNTLPSSGGAAEEKQSKPFKVRRAKASETLIQSQAPYKSQNGAGNKPKASTSQTTTTTTAATTTATTTTTTKYFNRI